MRAKLNIPDYRIRHNTLIVNTKAACAIHGREALWFANSVAEDEDDDGMDRSDVSVPGTEVPAILDEEPSNASDGVDEESVFVPEVASPLLAVEVTVNSGAVAEELCALDSTPAIPAHT